MIYLESKRFCMAILVVLFMSATASSYFKVEATHLKAPTKVLEGVKRIAVLDFDGYDGQEVADVIINGLLAESDGKFTYAKKNLIGTSSVEYVCFQDWAKTNVFEVVERSRLEGVMKELDFGQSGLVDDAQAAQIGDVLGVDAIITGSITASSDDQRTKEERTIYRPDNKGGSYNIIVDCLKRIANAEASFRVIGTETAQILASGKTLGSAEDEYCAEEIGKVRPADALIKLAVSNAAASISPHIKPYFVTFEGELEKIKTKEIKEDAASAAELAERGLLDQAYALYNKILVTDSYNPDLYFNIGILEEAVGNFVKANEMYTTASSLMPKTKKYAEAAKHALERTESNVKLKGFGFEPNEYIWNTSESLLVEATAKRVLVRGKSTDRESVFAEAREGSDVVAQVPGGVELKVISEEGDWYKVLLIGNKEGFIGKVKVK